MHKSSVSPHPSNVPIFSSRTNMHANVTTIQPSPNVAKGMPTDMSPSPNDPYLPPAFTVLPTAYISTYPGMMQAPNMCTSPHGLHSPAAKASHFLHPSNMVCQMPCTQNHLTHSIPQRLLSCLETTFCKKQTLFKHTEIPMSDSAPYIRTAPLCCPPHLLFMLL